MQKTARFKSNIGSPVIDAEAGLIKGCRIATLGAVSQAAEYDGRGMVMDAQMIKGLYDLAKNSGDKIPVFFTHGWYDSEQDPLNFDAGVWKDFDIKDGNLVANFQAFDTPYKAGIFSRAAADPNSIAVSPIFHYEKRNGSETLCNPTEFISADFVKNGAINKALFSANNKEPMDINDFITALADPQVKDALKAIIKSVEKNMDSTAVSDDDATAMESEAGVTDGDKKDTDAQKPALMRANLRIARLNSRLLLETKKALEDNKASILAEARVQAEAEFTAKLGKGGIIKQGGDDNTGATAVAKFTGAVKAIPDSGVKIGAATLAVITKQPELYQAMQKERGIFKK